jgi:hypothetical protein
MTLPKSNAFITLLVFVAGKTSKYKAGFIES